MADGDLEQGEHSRPFNLNMLPVLRELLRQRNVTQAAATLNMSQSAVSDALSRLRNVFDDELLVPSGRGFDLSEKAKRIEPLLSESLQHIEIMLNARTFDPEQSEGRIHIAASDYVTLVIGTDLVRRVREAAPNVCIQFHDADDQSIDALFAGHLDFVLLPESELSDIPKTADQMFVFEEQLVLVASRDKPVSEIPDTGEWGESGESNHTAELPLELSSPVIHQRFDNDIRNNIVLPGFMLLPFVAAQIDSVSVVHRRLAEKLEAAAGSKMITPLSPLPTVRVCALWQRARADDPLHCWLQELIAEISENLSK